VPARADDLIGPGVVPHHDPAVFRPASGRDERAAITRGLGRGLQTLLFFHPRHVILRQLDEGVHRNHIVTIELHAFRRRARDDAVNLLLILLVHLRPEHLLGGAAVEIPIAFGLTLQQRFHHTQQILDLFREQRAVLIADLIGRAFEVDVDPSITLESPGAFQLFIRRNLVGRSGLVSRLTATAKTHSDEQAHSQREKQISSHSSLLFSVSDLKQTTRDWYSAARVSKRLPYPEPLADARGTVISSRFLTRAVLISNGRASKSPGPAE